MAKKCTIYGILLRVDTGQVFVISGELGWELPIVIIDGYPSAGIVTREMTRLLGCTVISYRYVTITEAGPQGNNEAIYLLECHENIQLLDGQGKWVYCEELDSFSSVRHDHTRLIREVLHEQKNANFPNYRQPWENAGWYSQAIDWIKDTLSLLEVEVIEKPEQIKWWSLSSVLRVMTTQGYYYFKTNAVQPLFVDEIRLLTYLGSIWPNRVPVMVASDPDKKWMLLEDEGNKIGHEASIEDKKNLLKNFADLQIDSIEITHELLKHGCVDRRPQQMTAFIAPLLEDEFVVTRLTQTEMDELRSDVPKIMEMCSMISTYSVPCSLVHGDLHFGNISASSDGGFTFFDWTDASIAHPFMDMLLIYNEKDSAAREQLRDIYLSAWTRFEPMNRLLELWSLCGVVHAIYHAISYQYILRYTEERARRELESSLPYFLRIALRHLRELNDT